MEHETMKVVKYSWSESSGLLIAKFPFSFRHNFCTHIPKATSQHSPQYINIHFGMESVFDIFGRDKKLTLSLNS